MARVLDLKHLGSGVQVPFCPLADVVLGSPEFSFLAALVNSHELVMFI